MLKPLAISLLLSCAVVFAQTTDVPSPSSKSNSQTPYVYVPSPDYQNIDQEHILVLPKDPKENNGLGLWCNTLRGTGSIVIGIGGQLVFVAIDCPADIKKDT